MGGDGTAAGGQTVAVDLDGVPVDSEELWDEVRRGLSLPPPACRGPQRRPGDAGHETAEWSAYLTGTVGVPDRPEEVPAAVIGRRTEPTRRAEWLRSRPRRCTGVCCSTHIRRKPLRPVAEGTAPQADEPGGRDVPEP